MKPLLIVVFLATLALPCFAHEGHQPLPTKGVNVDLKSGRITLSRPARDAIDVRTVVVDQKRGDQRLRAYASLVSPWTKYAVVTSRLSGRVVSLPARPGDVVQAGQVLAELDSLDLQTLRLDVQQARTDVELSRKILDGLEPAATSGAVAGQRLIEAQQNHQQNLNTLQILQARMTALNVSEDMLLSDDQKQPLRLPIQSPISGIVVHADLAVGKFVEPTEHLLDVVDLSTVWVKIGVLERDWHRVVVGQPVRLSVNGLPGKSYDMQLDRLGSLLDAQTHQSLAWAEFKNDITSPALRPGMNGQAELAWVNAKATLSVPSQAVQSDGAERYVLVEEAATKEGSEYQKVAVVVGRQSGGQTEILAGKLLPGDRVVTQGGHELSSLFFLGVLRIGAESARTIGLKVEPVTDQAVDRIISLDGALDIPPTQRTTASAQLGGKLVSIEVDRGQSVQAGDVLAHVASLELQDLQLEFLRSQLSVELWRGTLSRLKAAGDSVPRRSLLEMEAKLKTFETRTASTRQKLLMLGLTADQLEAFVKTKRVIDALPVRAPIAGTVVDFDRRLGQVVRADESLFEIHDMTQTWVQAFVGERDSSSVKVGQTARVRLVALPDRTIEGTVKRVGPVVGQDSRVQAAWIEIPELSGIRLQHGMSARVTLTTDSFAPSLSIPLSALVRDGLRSFVFVQKADGTFERRRVELGRADDRFVEIKHGLTRGESVAISGVAQLQTAYSAVR